MSKKQEIIERLKNELGLNGLFTKKLDYGLDYEDVTEEVINKISSAIDEVYNDILESLPTPERMINFNFFKEKDRASKILGFEDCLSQVKQIIKSKNKSKK